MAQTLPRPKHEELLAAAVRLFRHRGYHATSMQDLAEAVGVQRGSLYHYIAAKEDLLWEIMARTMATLRSGIEPCVQASLPAAARLQQAIAAHLRAAAQLRDELTILHVELKSLSPGRRKEMVAVRDAYEQIFRTVVRDGMAAGEFRQVEEKATVFAILGACNWFTQWFDPAGPAGHEAFAETFSGLFLDGLRATDAGGGSAAEGTGGIRKGTGDIREGTGGIRRKRRVPESPEALQRSDGSVTARRRPAARWETRRRSTGEVPS